MANKLTANFIGVGDDYDNTSGIWTTTEARERGANPDHPSWGGFQIIQFDFLLIAGGGGGGGGNNTSGRDAGGGAGGYITSYGSSGSGGAGSDPVSSITYSKVQASPALSVTIGAGGGVDTNGSNSTFSGRDNLNVQFNYVAIGGGKGGGNSPAGSTGGSGGGNGHGMAGNFPVVGSTSTVAGTANQGTAGSGTYGVTPQVMNDYFCANQGGNFWCGIADTGYGGGAGGGAGSAASNSDGGNGQTSGITGSDVVRAGGGYGQGLVNATGTAGTGQSEAGGGGNAGSAGQNGTLILRYPASFTINFNSSQLTGTTTNDGISTYTIFTAGTGSISFT
jgi:hypothetical protein